MRLLPVAVLAALLTAPALAQDEAPPRFELGAVAAGGWTPDYPAAGQSHFKGLALPYFTYRGDVLRSDRAGLRGRFYRSTRVELDVSLGGALPTDSEDNNAREGMPDLDLLGEIGPNLRLNLAREGDSSRLDLELPLRAVFSTDFEGVEYRGLVAAPELSFKRANLLVDGDRLRLGVGPVFATDTLMDYFYEVKPRYARAGRPPDEAEGGYLGSRLQTSFRLPLTGRLSLFTAARLENHWGATNDDSPLFKRDINVAAVTGFALSLWRSTARTRVVDEPFE